MKITKDTEKAKDVAKESLLSREWSVKEMTSTLWNEREDYCLH